MDHATMYIGDLSISFEDLFILNNTDMKSKKGTLKGVFSPLKLYSTSSCIKDKCYRITVFTAILLSLLENKF
jgi:hypothetical protein